MGAEGGHSIGCSLGTLRMLHVLGVRYLTLTHNDNVAVGRLGHRRAGASAASRAFGREVVREMNRLGMLVDLSHVSADTMRDALDDDRGAGDLQPLLAPARCATTPATCPTTCSARCRPTAGVCMVTFVPEFVSPAAARVAGSRRRGGRARSGSTPTDDDAFAPFTASWQARPPQAHGDHRQVVAHVEHVREVAGVDHVGIGGDYDGTDVLPVGLEDVSGYPRLLAALPTAGWSEADLAQLAGGNTLRVLRRRRGSGPASCRRPAGPSLARIEDLDGVRRLHRGRRRLTGHMRARRWSSATRRATTSATYMTPAICSTSRTPGRAADGDDVGQADVVRVVNER